MRLILISIRTQNSYHHFLSLSASYPNTYRFSLENNERSPLHQLRIVIDIGFGILKRKRITNISLLFIFRCCAFSFICVRENISYEPKYAIQKLGRCSLMFAPHWCAYDFNWYATYLKDVHGTWLKQ